MERNAKMQVNEWMNKVNNHVPYTTEAIPGGFTATLVLPLEGAGDAGVATGTGTNKKQAEMNCAENALAILNSFGLLAVMAEPSKRASKGMKAPRPAPSAVAQGVAGGAYSEEFESFKQVVYEKVNQNPGKRTTCYMMMLPVGEKRKKVTAALYKLAEDGLVIKHEPTAGRNMVPFWAPPGYSGPFGGNVTEEDLGEGRALPMTEVKMVCYDVLSESPNQTAQDILAKAMALGHAWDVKCVNAALYMMEKEGTAVGSLEQSSVGVHKRWSAV